jgi:hypothetical protein
MRQALMTLTVLLTIIRPAVSFLPWGPHKAEVGSPLANIGGERVCGGLALPTLF